MMYITGCYLVQSLSPGRHLNSMAWTERSVLIFSCTMDGHHRLAIDGRRVSISLYSSIHSRPHHYVMECEVREAKARVGSVATACSIVKVVLISESHIEEFYNE